MHFLPPWSLPFWTVRLRGTTDRVAPAPSRTPPGPPTSVQQRVSTPCPFRAVMCGDHTAYPPAHPRALALFPLRGLPWMVLLSCSQRQLTRFHFFRTPRRGVAGSHGTLFLFVSNCWPLPCPSIRMLRRAVSVAGCLLKARAVQGLDGSSLHLLRSRRSMPKAQLLVLPSIRVPSPRPTVRSPGRTPCLPPPRDLAHPMAGRSWACGPHFQTVVTL